MSELPWLTPALEQTLALYAEGRLPHALLIRGSDGWGEVELANSLALELLERTSVTDARQLAHPDLFWLQPEGSVIKVDDVRALSAFAVGTRQSARCKVAIVESAERMNLNAANALLKTLEEPPPDTYLLLTTCRPARLLATVTSRCQTITIERDLDAASAWLEKHWPAAEIEEKLFECGDAPLAVHRAMSDGEPPLGPLLEALLTKSPLTREIAVLLEWPVERLTSGWYRHCLALLAGHGRLPGSRTFDNVKLCDFVDELQAVRHQLLTTNSANQRLLYERLAVRWLAALASV